MSTDSGDTVRNATDPEILTRAEMEGRRQAVEYARFLIDRVPGYEHAALVALSSQIGLRETRTGLRRLPADAGRRPRSPASSRTRSVCVAHRSKTTTVVTGTGTTWKYLPNGSAVGIPLSTLIVRDGANSLAAGRCFSATHDAQASVRSMAQCMAMGQAAGTTAALAVAKSGLVRDVPVGDVREVLRERGDSGGGRSMTPPCAPCSEMCSHSPGTDPDPRASHHRLAAHRRPVATHPARERWRGGPGTRSQHRGRHRSDR